MSTALVTGTSTGIGFATALRLARDGHDVVATMRDPEAGAAPLLDAAADAGSRLRVAALDVEDDASVAAAFAEAGAVDVLVNNAGTSPVGSIEELPVARWKSLFETNVFGVVRCVQAVLPSMRQRGSGCIVNISSVTGRTVLPMFGPYAASKFAVEALSEALAIEGRPFGIRVALIEPGAIATPIREKTTIPPRESPYREVAKNWGFAQNWAHDRASPPDVVADAVALAAATEEWPLRWPVGQGCLEEIEHRARHTDESWIDLWSSPTADFLERYRQLTGIDLLS
jgi:NAD(P)-dependent dehydrogenase (short-subunit alcohol dehydrogenase family)